MCGAQQADGLTHRQEWQGEQGASAAPQTRARREEAKGEREAGRWPWAGAALTWLVFSLSSNSRCSPHSLSSASALRIIDSPWA